MCVLWRKDVLKIAAIWFLLPSLTAFGQSRTEAEQKVILQKAERLYFEKCANCHAADGSGHTAAATKMKVTDLRSKQVRQMSDEELYTATAQGKAHESYPHAFLHTGLTEQQIRDLIKYIRTFGNNRK
jgi:mono/diheme cytochrome c family protein